MSSDDMQQDVKPNGTGQMGTVGGSVQVPHGKQDVFSLKWLMHGKYEEDGSSRSSQLC